MFSIGELSRQTGVKVPTIRYYEQIGLLQALARTQGNQRRYEQAQIDRLEFIKHARALGFSIESIGSLLDLADHPDRPCTQATEIARDQLTSVRAKIAQLQRLEQELARITRGCEGDGVVDDCYVLSALANHGQCETEH